MMTMMMRRTEIVRQLVLIIYKYIIKNMPADEFPPETFFFHSKNGRRCYQYSKNLSKLSQKVCANHSSDLVKRDVSKKSN